MKVVNKVVPTPDQFKAFFSDEEDGAFIMVNLLKFHDKAQYADGSNPEISGAEAYMIYGAAVGDHIERVGGRSMTSGLVTALMLGEVEELWDMIALVEYPSLKAFQSMIMAPDYQDIAIHRDAGLAGQLNIKIKAAPQD